MSFYEFIKIDELVKSHFEARLSLQMIHAPNLNVIFEAGSMATILEQGMPLSVGNTRP